MRTEEPKVLRAERAPLGVTDREAVSQVYAENASGEAAPWGAPVSITGEAPAGSGILQFDKPGDPPYGVLLASCPDGVLGLVALGGAPFRLRIAIGESVAVGTALQPVTGGWLAEAGGSVWTALSAPYENECLVAFAGGGGLPRYVRALEDMTDASTAYVCRYVEGNGSLGDEVNVRPPYGQDIENGEEGALMTDGDGNLRFLPCHGRTDQNTKSVMEVRDSDPATSEAGRYWLVT